MDSAGDRHVSGGLLAVGHTQSAKLLCEFDVAKTAGDPPLPALSELDMND